MKVLLIGFGSIGRRHYDVLKAFSTISEIHVVTKQTLTEMTTFTCLDDVSNLEQYDYFLIASETSKHFEQLNWLNERVANKKIFCEKPLFEKNQRFKNSRNDIFVGYVLRFHPLLQQLKSLIEVEGQTILSLNVSCGSYLPDWRTNIDYRESYSAKKSQGGGVLLDLSHELDYTNWITGGLTDIKSFQTKVSNLEIDSDDFVAMIATTKERGGVNLSIDYFSKLSHRKLLLNTNEFTLELDLIKNTMTQTFLSGEVESYETLSLERNYLFEQMHNDILFNSPPKFACDLKSGLEVMAIIQTIQDENNE